MIDKLKALSQFNTIMDSDTANSMYEELNKTELWKTLEGSRREAGMPALITKVNARVRAAAEDEIYQPQVVSLEA